MPDKVVRTIPPGITETRLAEAQCLGNRRMFTSSSIKAPNLARSIKVVVRGTTATMMVTRLCKGPDT